MIRKICVGLLILLSFIILYTVLKYRKTIGCLKARGIPHIGAGASLGGFLRLLTGRMSMVELQNDLYQKALETKSPLAAISDFTGLANLLITDLDLLRAICVKDYDHFINRPPVASEQSSGYFKKMLFCLNNDQWKGTRSKMSPAFTSGKIRRIFEIFRISSERLETFLKRQMGYPNATSVDLDFLKIFPKYALDVVASCAFGVESESFQFPPDKKSVFEEMAAKYGFRFTLKAFFNIIVMFAAPKVANFFGLDVLDYESQEYFSSIIKSQMKRRRETGVRREDFLQFMMEAQEGLLKADEESNLVMNGHDERKASLLTNEEERRVVFDDDTVIASTLLFLMAGIDPTLSTLLLTLYALAVEPEVQEKLYEEVKDVLSRNDGCLTHEAVMQMTYLDMVLNESMRHYTPAVMTNRYCNKDYSVPGTNIVIEKGSSIHIPIVGIHHDPRYYPNPEKFIPERFSPENKASRHPLSFLSYGHGYRNCIGMRFGSIKVKTVIAKLVHTFHFSPCSKTKIPIVFDQNPNVKPKGDMWLNVTLREGR